MKRISILLALALVVAMTLPAAAEVEEVVVGGSIQVRGQLLTPGTDIVEGDGEVEDSITLFNDDIKNLDWVTQRTRVNVDAKLSGNVRGFVELQSFDIWGYDGDAYQVANPFDPFPEDDEDGDGDGNSLVELYQGYIEMNDIADYPVQLRIGRQELVFGREWLVGNNDAGINFCGLSFDGVKATYDDEMVAVSAWWAKLEERTGPGQLGEVDEADGDLDFAGVYGTYKGLEDIAIDAYWLLLRDGEDDVFNLHTIGARVAGGMEVGGGMLDGSIEAALQTGNTGDAPGAGDADFEGWALSAMGGFTFTDVQTTPRLELEYAYFSGDDDYGDDDLGEFVRMFSDVHYGELNLGGNLDMNATNLHIIRVGASAEPVEKLTLKGDLYFFMLAEDDDDGGACTFGQDQGPEFDDSVGMELDLVADYQYTEDLNLRVGWAHFFADDAIENSSWGNGQDDDVDYIYAQAKLVF